MGIQCPVGSYMNWLKDSDFVAPTCPVCSSEFQESSPSVRLTCFDIIHPTCLEHYASQLPAHTAQAGYTCPKCSQPIIPHEDDNSDLAITLRDVLGAQDWAQSFLSDSNRGVPAMGSSKAAGMSSPGHAGNPGEPSSNRTVAFGSVPISRKTVVDDDDKPNFSEVDADEAEHKYKRRGVMQLLVALGLVTPGQGGHVLNSKRLVIVFLVVSVVLLFWVLFKSASMPAEENAV